MMVALWFLAIGVLAFSGYRIHNYVLSRRAHKRYDALSDVRSAYAQAWLQTWNYYWSFASTKDRGFLLDWQIAELDALNERYGAVLDEMDECAEEF